MGRGGAAFPTGRKWDAVARDAGAPALPGLQRRRVRAGHVQGSRADGGRSVRARRGDDHRRLRDRLRARLHLHPRRISAGARAPARTRSTQARGARLARRRHHGRGRSLRHRDPPRRRRLHLRRGDGALQLDRGPPRRAAQQAAVPGRRSGCSASRRVVNNVETLVNVLDIVLDGGAAFAAHRHASSRPARGCSACPGSVARPGVYEVPFGATLRELIELAGGVRGGRRCRRCCSAARPAPSSAPDELDVPLTFEGTRAAGATLGSGVVMVFDDTRRPDRDRCCGSPRSSATSRAASACPAGSARCARRRRCSGSRPSSPRGTRRRRARAARRGRARRCATRRSAGWGRPPRAPSSRRSSELRRLRATGAAYERRHRVDRSGARPHATLDDRRRAGPRARGRDDPRRLQAASASTRRRSATCETLTPVNVCRVCVVEVEGSRVLVPSCARKVEDGHGGPHRLATACATAASWCWSSSPRRSTSRPRRHVERWIDEYGASPERFGPPAPPAPAGDRDHAPPGTTTPATARRGDRRPAGQGRQRALRARLLASASSATSASRPAARDAQNTFAIAVAGRGFDARISTEFATPLPDSACVYCGNCIGVCPTGALMFKSEYDLRAGRDVGRGRARP